MPLLLMMIMMMIELLLLCSLLGSIVVGELDITVVA